jgi:hypothetical protein
MVGARVNEMFFSFATRENCFSIIFHLPCLFRPLPVDHFLFEGLVIKMNLTSQHRFFFAKSSVWQPTS